MPWTEYDKGKIESYILAVQHIFNPLSTSSLSAPGSVGVDEPIDVGVDEPMDAGVVEPMDAGMDEPTDAGMDEPMDVGHTDPSTISEPESGRTSFRLCPDRMLITI